MKKTYIMYNCSNVTVYTVYTFVKIRNYGADCLEGRGNGKTMERRKAREAVMELLFEKEFNKEVSAEDTYRVAEEIRELEEDKYLQSTYFGVLDNLAEIDELINNRSIGWKTKRMTKVSLSVMRIAAYEMKYCEDIPFNVSINEALEICKKYDDEKAPAFVNGVLNGIAEDLGLK